MVYSPYPPYEILSTDKLSYEEIIKLKKVEEVVDKYYNSQKFNNILNYFYPKFETPFIFFSELGDFFERRGYFNRNIGNSEYYKVFLDFNMEVLKMEDRVLKDIIKYDYLSFNKKRGIPSFLKGEINDDIKRKIKDKYRAEYSFKEYSIEKFSIDMEKYCNKNVIIDAESYYLVGNNGEIVKILF